MAQREHLLRHDLITLKLYSWHIPTKKLRNVAIQLDIFKDQKINDFFVVDDYLKKIYYPMVVILSSGRLLLFSWISGQLVRNMSDSEFLSNAKYSKVFFNSMSKGLNSIAMGSNKLTVNVNLVDKNNHKSREEFNELLGITKSRFGILYWYMSNQGFRERNMSFSHFWDRWVCSKLWTCPSWLIILERTDDSNPLWVFSVLFDMLMGWLPIACSIDWFFNFPMSFTIFSWISSSSSAVLSSRSWTCAYGSYTLMCYFNSLSWLRDYISESIRLSSFSILSFLFSYRSWGG